MRSRLSSLFCFHCSRFQGSCGGRPAWLSPPFAIRAPGTSFSLAIWTSYRFRGTLHSRHHVLELPSLPPPEAAVRSRCLSLFCFRCSRFQGSRGGQPAWLSLPFAIRAPGTLFSLAIWTSTALAGHLQSMRCCGLPVCFCPSLPAWQPEIGALLGCPRISFFATVTSLSWFRYLRPRQHCALDVRRCICSFLFFVLSMFCS